MQRGATYEVMTAWEMLAEREANKEKSKRVEERWEVVVEVGLPEQDIQAQ